MSVKLPIYLDYAATTPMDERVAQKMMQYMTLEVRPSQITLQSKVQHTSTKLKVNTSSP